MTTIRSELQQKAQNTLIQYAIFRIESALVLALTIILTFLYPRPFFWWPRYGWLVLGVVALGIIIYSSLTDAEANAQILLNVFQEQFNPRAINDRHLREKVESALEYQRRIETQIRQQSGGIIRDRLVDTAGQITAWLANIYQLAIRLDAYGRDDLLERERASLPREIETLLAQRLRLGGQARPLAGPARPRRPHEAGILAAGPKPHRPGNHLQPSAIG
jgi:hypothetical protein